jgi:ribosomal protein S18 acetylase RimI-like enzyme
MTLDNPVWAALTGPHAGLAEVCGRAARYEPGISVFAALSDPTDPAAWADLAALAGPGGEGLIAAVAQTPPPAFEYLGGKDGVQLVDDGVRAEADPEAVVLTGADVPEILDLVDRTRPGPFSKRTVEMGTYLGLRRDGRLAAMAGERLRGPGWTEISAVCTDPEFRGQGLAARLTRAVAANIRARGDLPLLHAAHDNTAAIRLYERLGFAVRTPITFAFYRMPARTGESAKIA